MSNLYALSAELRAIENELDEVPETEGQDAWLDDLILSKMAAIEGEGNMLAANAIAWYKSIQAEIESRDEEIAKLRARNKAAENRGRAVKEYLKRWLVASAQSKFKCAIGTAYTMKGRESVLVDVAEVPNWPADVYDAAAEAGAVKEEIKVLSTKLKEAFPDTWRQLPGVRVEQGEETLVIK